MTLLTITEAAERLRVSRSQIRLYHRRVVRRDAAAAAKAAAERLDR